MTIENLITDNIDIWTAAIKNKKATGRGSSKKIELYGIKKLRELILELAVRGMLVAQDPSDEPASALLEKNFTEQERLILDENLKTKASKKILESDEYLVSPRSWGKIKLGNLAKFIDYRGKTPKKLDSGVRLITAKNVKFGFISLQPEEFISQDEYSVWMTRGFPQIGDILFTPEAPLGNVAQVELKERFALAQRAICFQLHLPDISNFLRLFLMSPNFQKLLKEKATGTTAKGIKASVLKELLIYLPPQKEQHRIVAKVDELMALCDQLEQQTESSIDAHKTLVEVLLATLTDSKNANELNQNWARVSEFFDTLFTTEHSIDQLKQTILQLAVMGKLVPQNPNDEPASKLLERIAAEKAQLIKDKKIKKQKTLPLITDEEKPFELPNGWEWCRLGSIGVGATGKTPNTRNFNYFNGEIQFVGPGQITPQGELLISEKTLTALGLEQSTTANKGDLLMVCIGGSIGKSTLAKDRIAFNQQINAMHPILFSSEFLKTSVSTNQFYESVLEKSTGSATPIINRGKWEELIIPVSPLSEQNRIVAKVERLMNICDKLKICLTHAQQTQMYFADVISAKKTDRDINNG
ncbi:restriction endonuclease subunit S [Psychromonas sp. PT13]|uniref:restriction endonuclease subunit S n=1 Tax=Psychromonas sp. PT13 TaxID=3439547 RepID=UPI003EBF025B